jgi:hypothetical protein
MSEVANAQASQIGSVQSVVRLGLQPDLADPGVFVAEERGWLAEAGLALEVRHLGWGEIRDSLISRCLPA